MSDSTSGDAAASPVGPGGSAVPGLVAELLERAEDRLAVPLPGDDRPVPLLDPTPALAVLSPGNRPRYEPRNLAFADGLEGWRLSGSFTEHASHSHWQDYSCAAEHGIAVLSAAVPQPAGFAFLGQEIYADDYRGAVVTFRGQFRTEDAAGTDAASRAGLFLRVIKGRDVRKSLTERRLRRPRQQHRHHRGRSRLDQPRGHGAGPRGLQHRPVRLFLADRGRIELRNAELTRGA